MLTRRSRRRRIVGLLLAGLAWGAWLGWRVVDLEVVQAADLTHLAHAEHLHTFTLPAPRGEILDRHGLVLAMDQPAYQVVASPREITAAAEQSPGLINREAGILAGPLGTTAARLEPLLRGQRWYRLLAPALPAARARPLLTQASRLVGISLVPTSRRTYPDGALAGQVLGFVGTNGQGLAGIEYADNRYLAGRPGSWTVATTVDGTPLPATTVRRITPVPGDNVELTLDSEIQNVAERALDQAVAQARALGGTVIVMDPRTGALLALANAPALDPNHFSSAPRRAFADWAVSAAVPPGSIFKPVTAAAALSDGVVTPTTRFDTRGYKIVDGVRINDWNPNGWGWITFTKGFEESSDQVFMDVGLKLGTRRLYAMMRAFGLFHRSGVGLPGDASGIFLPENQVNAVDLATTAFGQGFAVTPLQMLTAVAAIADDGTLLKPRIRRAVIAPSGRVVRRFHPAVEGHPVTPAVAHALQTLMEKEVADGTGVKAQVPGYVMAGKTGTAQKVIAGRTSNSQFISSFIGFGPMPHPRFAMLVMINRPVGAFYGGDVAAPVFSRIAGFLMHYWDIPPTGHAG